MGSLAKGFKKIEDSINEIFHEIKNSVQIIADSSKELSSKIEEISSGAQSQAENTMNVSEATVSFKESMNKVLDNIRNQVAGVEETASSISEISNTVKTLNENKFGIEEVIIPKLKTIMKTQAVILESIWSEIAANKRSLWRAEVYGRRFPNSARLIIEPIIDENIHSIDGVQIPLDIFRVIFPHDIKKILKKKKVHPNKIHNYLDPDYVLTEEERDVIRNR